MWLRKLVGPVSEGALGGAYTAFTLQGGPQIFTASELHTCVPYNAEHRTRIAFSTPYRQGERVAAYHLNSPNRLLGHLRAADYEDTFPASTRGSELYQCKFRT